MHARVGLKKLLQPGEEVPALFSDPLFLRSSYWVLSTSAVFSKYFSVYGWGEVRFFRPSHQPLE
jgi:carnitine O-acetyltransferase